MLLRPAKTSNTDDFNLKS